MTRYLTVLLLAALLIASVGCGRDGEVSTSLGNGQSNRMMSVGDKIEYDITINMVRQDGTVARSQDGTVTVEVRKGFKHKPIPKKVKYHFLISQTLDLGDSANGEMDWLGQDAEGAIYLLGRLTEGSEWSLFTGSSPQLDLPAVLSDTTSWNRETRLTGGTETSVGKVVAVEEVTTHAGEFEAYKTRISGTTSSGNIYKGYTWFRPEFPLGVKVVHTITNKKNPKAQMKYVQTLKSYKFAD